MYQRHTLSLSLYLSLSLSLSLSLYIYNVEKRELLVVKMNFLLLVSVKRIYFELRNILHF